MEINKEQVKKILDELAVIDPKDISKEDGLMDWDKLKAKPEVQDAMKQLNEMGVTRGYLMDNFFLAGMSIGHLLNK